MPACLYDFELKILKVSVAVGASFEDVDLVVEAFALAVGFSVDEVVVDAVSVVLDGLDDLLKGG